MDLEEAAKIVTTGRVLGMGDNDLNELDEATKVVKASVSALICGQCGYADILNHTYCPTCGQAFMGV